MFMLLHSPWSTIVNCISLSSFLWMLFIWQESYSTSANACRAFADKQHSVRKGSKCKIGVTVSLYHLRSSQAERLNHTLAWGRERERVKDTFSTHRHVKFYIKSSRVKSLLYCVLSVVKHWIYIAASTLWCRFVTSRKWCAPHTL